MVTSEIEMLQEIATNINRFMENQTRILNDLVSQVAELRARVASCETSQDNFKTRLDKLVNQDTPPVLPAAAMSRSADVEGNDSATHVNASSRPTIEVGASPIAPRRSRTSLQGAKNKSRSMQRSTNLVEDRRAFLGTIRPQPLPRSSISDQPLASQRREDPPRPMPRRINSPRQTKARSTPSLPTTVRFCELHIMDEPIYPRNLSAPLIAPTKEKFSLQVSQRSSTSRRSPSSSRSPTLPSPPSRSLTLRSQTLPSLGSTLSPRAPPPTCPSPLATRRYQGTILPRRNRPGNSRTQRITERGVRGHIRCFIAGRDFGFVTRSDNGKNVFLHRNELINVPGDSAVTLKEGDVVLFDVMRTNRTPAARNVKLLSSLTL